MYAYTAVCIRVYSVHELILNLVLIYTLYYLGRGTLLVVEHMVACMVACTVACMVEHASNALSQVLPYPTADMGSCIPQSGPLFFDQEIAI